MSKLVSTTIKPRYQNPRNLLWAFLRMNKVGKNPESQDMPGWSGFQELCGKPSFPVRVGYLPPIPAPPTEMRVIYAAINRSLDIMDKLGNKFIFMEVDQAIYHKILDAMFRMEKEGTAKFGKVIPGMGRFHVVLCMTRTIYSRFKQAGIVELLSSAGLGGKGTIKKALKGGDTKEALYLHKLLSEAFLRSKVEYLKKSNMLLSTVPDISDICQSDIDSALDKGFKEALPNLKGDMALSIESLIEMINMLINTIHFQRVGNWKEFLEVILQFLPCCFNHNRHNYARNLSYLYRHMRELEKDNEEAYIFMLKRGFTGSLTGKPHSRSPMDKIVKPQLVFGRKKSVEYLVKLTMMALLKDGPGSIITVHNKETYIFMPKADFTGSLTDKPHSRIPMDQIIETTVNRWSKEVGGICGETDNDGANERWIRVNHLPSVLKEHQQKTL